MRLEHRRARAPARPRRRDDDAARHAARQLPGAATGAGRVRVTLRPRGATRGVPRAPRARPRWTVQPLRLPRRRSPPRSSSRDFGDERPRRQAVRCASSARSPSASLARRARASTCSSTSGTSPRRARRCSTRSPTRRTYPRVVEAGLHRRRGRRRAGVGKESRQHFKGRLPYHLHTRSRIVRARARRTSSRPRSTATCAATGSGR